MLRDGPVSLFDKRVDILGLKLNRLEDEGIVMRSGMTPTDAMHLKGDFDVFDTRASRLGAQCVLKSYRGAVAAEDPAAIEALADEIYAPFADTEMIYKAGAPLRRPCGILDSFFPYLISLRS